MTSFDDRERGCETKFAHDQEMAFRVTARRHLTPETAVELKAFSA